jgi:hypothetical protein
MYPTLMDTVLGLVGHFQVAYCHLEALHKADNTHFRWSLWRGFIVLNYLTGNSSH